MLTVNSVVQSQPGRNTISTGRVRQIHLLDQQLPGELRNLVKTDDVEEVLLVHAALGVSAHFAVNFKSNCNDNRLTKCEFLFFERGVDLPIEPR